MIILIGDAPPLEKPLSKYEMADLITKADENKIKMNFYPIVVTQALTETLNNPDVKTFEKEKIIPSVFPNPVSTTINITLATSDVYSIEIFNAAGLLVLSDKFSGNLWKRDLSSLQNGAYIARVIRQDKKFETVKFIVYK
jgi:hypothetical protein